MVMSEAPGGTFSKRKAPTSSACSSSSRPRTSVMRTLATPMASPEPLSVTRPLILLTLGVGSSSQVMGVTPGSASATAGLEARPRPAVGEKAAGAGVAPGAAGDGSPGAAGDAGGAAPSLTSTLQ